MPIHTRPQAKAVRFSSPIGVFLAGLAFFIAISFAAQSHAGSRVVITTGDAVIVAGSSKGWHHDRRVGRWHYNDDHFDRVWYSKRNHHESYRHHRSSGKRVILVPTGRYYTRVVPQPHVHRAFTPEWIAYCARKYKSFNPRTGHYLAYSGTYRMCR